MDKTGSAVVLTSQTAASKIPASLDGLNESQLRVLLETTFNFEERLAIRRAIRQQRKKTVESQEASRTTTGNTSSHLQNDSSEARRRLLKPNGEVEHKSNGISSRRSLPSSNGHNLKVKTTFKSHGTDKSETRDVQTTWTHGSEKATLDSDSTVGKVEQRISDCVGLESEKLDHNRASKKEENELDFKMDDIESKNLKNISLRDTLNADKELKECVREIEKERDHGMRGNRKENLDLVKDDKEPKEENVTSLNEAEDDSGCEMKKERSDEESLKKDDNEKERDTGKSGIEFEADAELLHRLVEVHIDDDDIQKEDEERDSREALSRQMKESNEISNPVGKAVETKEIDEEETVNKEENVAGDVVFSQDDCSLEKEKIGLSDSEITDEIVSNRTKDNHVESETEGNLKLEGVFEVDHQLLGSRQDDVAEVEEKDCNSNDTSVREKEETVRDCHEELKEFQTKNTLRTDSHKQKDLSRLNLEVSLEEKYKTSELQMTEGITEGISSESGEGFLGKSEGINNNVTDTKLSDETSAHRSEKGPQEVCDSIEKIRPVDTGSKGKDRSSSGGQGELHGTSESEEEKRFHENERKGRTGTTSSGKEEELQGISERCEKSRSIETETEGKDRTVLSGREKGLVGTSESSAKMMTIDTESEGKGRGDLRETDKPQNTTENREKTRSVETESDGMGTTSSGKEEASEEEDKQELKLEDINDETVLRKMLDDSFDFEERRKIRAAIRALKKKQQSQPSPEKKFSQQSYLSLQNGSWKSGRNTPVSKTDPSPRTVTNSGRKLGLGKQSSLEKELPQCHAKSNLASKLEAELIINDKSSASNKGGSLSGKKDEEVSKVQLSSKEKHVSSVPEKQQPYNSSSSLSSCTARDNRIVSSETGRESVKVECTLEDERDRARQRRREWQRSLLRSYEEPETSSSEADVKREEKTTEKDVIKQDENLKVNSTGSAAELKTEDAFPKRQYGNQQSEEDDDNSFLKSAKSYQSEVRSSKKSSSPESCDQPLETSQGSPSQEMTETYQSGGALPVTTQIDTEIGVDATPQKDNQVGEDKCAIRSKEGALNSDKGSSDMFQGVKGLTKTKEGSLSSKNSSSFEEESENDETPKHFKRSDVVTVEIGKGEDGQKDEESDKKESMKESEGIKEEKLSPLKRENLNKTKEERSTFLSSRWREPKKANFKDLRRQFQGGVEKQKEEKKEDKVLKGVKGRVSQAALLFNSPSASSPSRQPLSSEPSTPKRGSSSTPRRTSERRITDQKLAGNSTRRFSSEFSLSDKSKNKAETKSSLQVDSNKDEETSQNKGLEESPSTSIYMTPVGTPGSPDIFYTPKEAMNGTPANLADTASVSKPSEVKEESLLHSKRTTLVEGDQQKKKVKVEAGKLSPEETPQAQETDTTTMAPTVEQITDETTLEKMLEEATIFEDRKKIRARLRELRKQKRGGGDSIDPASQDTTPELDMDTGDADATTVTTERKRTRASALTVNATQSTENKEVKPVGTTALSPVSPAAKTVKTDSSLSNDHSTKVVEKDDGKTKTMTMTSVKTAPGAKSTQVTTMTKTDDGTGTKSASVKQETTTTKVETSGDGTKSSFSKTTTSTFSSSSSSSSTDKPATGKPQSKFQMELEEKRKKRAEQQKADEVKWKADQEARRKAAYEKKKKEEAEASKKKASLMDKFGGKATTVGPTGPKKTVGGGSTRMMAQNPATIKAKLLEWAQRSTRGYANVKIENFSGSWCNGMAFCAVIHSYYPDAFDFNSLDPNNRRYNFDLAFDTAEKLADIYPLLETDDMIMMKNKPDWKCVFTYVQALYRGLHKAAGQVPS